VCSSVLKKRGWGEGMETVLEMNHLRASFFVVDGNVDWSNQLSKSIKRFV
jgi:hypothetical protein